MKRSPIVKRSAYETFSVKQHTVFILKPWQGAPDSPEASDGDYCVTPEGIVYTFNTGYWMEAVVDTEGRRSAIAAWKLKNRIDQESYWPTHLYSR